MRWWDYVSRVAGATATPSEIARRVGLTPSSVTRWQISTPKPETAAAFARAYGRPVIEALIAAGVVTAEEAGVREVAADLSSIPIDDLLAEIRKRVKD
ncbi:helix-turn-helix domain-containing protein [Nonomuraea sp. CA-218870]|uniref:helix-turn-helix domain-containing protein n=1 Tax=Nonomuraea sp. CA-218870 TaxID=3239998 RepID=UPI003D8E7DA5